MAQNIITLASEETCQDILARVREIETRVGEMGGNIGEVTSKVSSAWIPRLKTATIHEAGTIRLEIPYSESEYEIYYLSGEVVRSSGQGTCSNKLTIDGKTIANISSYNARNVTNAKIEMRNLSYCPFPTTDRISVDSHIGDEILKDMNNEFYLAFFERFPFHSLVWEGVHLANIDATFSIYYLEKAE